jgi:hypothetical protein
VEGRIESTITNLSCDGNLLAIKECYWTLLLIRVIEYNSNGSFGDAGLSTLIDEVLLILCTHLGGEKFKLVHGNHEQCDGTKE